GQAQGHVMISENAIVQGEIYSSGTVHHSGAVRGSLVAAEFVLRTAASAYKGHLLDATLEQYDLGTTWGFGCTSTSKDRTIIKWGALEHSERKG
ncbi:MAG: hypothetical protein M3R08_08635, partial [Bacteroidota bacterium]|nr:hypothetical protein [Bacteroidota bacterium]